MRNQPAIYIVADKPKGQLHLFVTSNLSQSLLEGEISENCNYYSSKKESNGATLVYFKGYNEVTEAILRIKQLQNWHNQWKVELIESNNPHWVDLTPQLQFRR